MELTWAIPDTTPPAFPIENQGISTQLPQRWYQEDSTFPENPCGGSGVLRLDRRSGNMREDCPHKTEARIAAKARAAGFLRSQLWWELGNTHIELPERFPAPPSVTPLFEFRRKQAPVQVFLGFGLLVIPVRKALGPVIRRYHMAQQPSYFHFCEPR